MNVLRALIILGILASGGYAQNGIVKNYYSRGKIESEVSYVRDVLDGISKYYYENGNLKAEVIYFLGKIHGVIKEYHENGMPRLESSVEYGIRNGITKYFYENGALKQVLTYEFGRIVKKVDIPYDASYDPPDEVFANIKEKRKRKKDKDEYFCVIEFCAEPIGGTASILKRTLFPDTAVKDSVKGLVSVSVEVSTEGRVLASSLVKGLGRGIDEAIIKAVNETRFLPGEDKGRPIRSSVTFSIPVELGNNSVKPVFAFEEPQKEKSNTAVRTTLIKSDNLISSKSVYSEDPEAEKIRLLVGDLIFDANVEKIPVPEGGYSKITENIYLSSSAKEKQKSGKVLVRATINESGRAVYTRIMSGIDSDYDFAAEVAVIETRFYPGLKNGIPARAEVTIIVEFN